MPNTSKQQQRRVCVQLTGYITVSAASDEDAIKQASQIPSQHWDWETFTPDLVTQTGTVVEAYD